MSQASVPHLTQRVRRLAEFLAGSDVTRVCIERDDELVEVARRVRLADAAAATGTPDGVSAEPAAHRFDTIKADLVGIFRLSRPVPLEGEVLDGDRELGYVEALGIRNPVHSLGGGRIAAMPTADGSAVEYGQPLFLIDRG